MILYAPLINSSVPGFMNKDTTTIQVNFMHNMAVGEVAGMLLAIKPYNDNSNNWHQIYQFDKTKINIEQGYVQFECTCPDYDFVLGDYYKVKIAYCEGTEANPIVGPYSTIGISRCAGNSNTKISVLSGIKRENIELSPSPAFNKNRITYIGNYQNEDLPSEIVYKYRFTFKEEGAEQYWQDTGWLIRSDPMSFTVPYELEYFKNYLLTYEVITVNGLQLAVTYPIFKTGEIPGYYEGNVIAFQDAKAIENGYIQIQLIGDQTPDGTFRLIRRCLNEEPARWEELTKFSLSRLSDTKQFTWKDLSIEQGKTYVYAIQQYSISRTNDTVSYSQRVESEPITADFEHIFIGDGTRQLRLAFNPEISSLKDTISEQKVDTLTSRYPFFFRNGNIQYKELSISGLLSYFMDLDELFMPQSDLIRYTDTDLQLDVNLTGANFYAERQFKMEVLNWLNNGEFKILRSPAEGNYVVRLMNVSLSLNATVSRMLHSVNATGYEGMEYTYSNLQDHKLIFWPEPLLENQKEKTVIKTYKDLTTFIKGYTDDRRRLYLSTADSIKVYFENGRINQTLNVWMEGREENDPVRYTFDDDKTVVITLGRITKATYMDFNIANDLTQLENVTIRVEYTYTTEAFEQFSNRIAAGNYYLFTSTPDEAETNLASNKEIITAFSIQAEADSRNTKNVSFTIHYKDNTESTHIIQPGEVKQFYNFNSIANIQKDAGLTLHCYVYMHSDVSSALGSFILGQSYLQGVV